jgi:uncharacterized linocin/CFP29 family protein
MSVSPYQPQRPIQISRSFFLHRQQSGDDEILKALITQAAADLAQAEDGVILLGAAAAPVGAPPLPFLANITYDPAEVAAQVSLLPAGPANVTQSILDRIIAGIQGLRANGYYGEYYAIVALDLYSEAFRNIGPGRNAPIDQIKPLLAPDGFLGSNTLPATTGVIFSLARGTVRLLVPVDTYVDITIPNDNQGRQRFRVAQQFRLMIDDANATLAL